MTKRLTSIPKVVLVLSVLLTFLPVKAPAQALGPGPTADCTVGLNSDGTVYTWGNNWYGQLGDGTTTDSSIPVKVKRGEYSGTEFLGDDPNNKITSVTLGMYHSGAIAEEGTVYTWGYNEYGQLGDGTTTDSSIPVKVKRGEYSGTEFLGDDASNKIVAVALGEYHSIALAADGTVYTWGHNSSGQLGDGTTTDSSTPVKVKKGAYSGTTYLGDDSNNKIIAVALGSEHSVALAEDGTVYTWGYNGSGQLGDNTTTDSSTPVKVKMGEYSGTEFLGDNASNKIISVALGYKHSIALAADGTVYTWGRNRSGQLGDSTTTNRSTPIKVKKGAYSGTTYLGDNQSNKITAVTLGGDHSVALAADGTVYTWGDNSYGQLGDSTTTNRSTPIKVKKGAYSGTTYLGDDQNNKITAVALGYTHSIALAADGTVYTWGCNWYGQLGDNSTTDRYTPIKVSGEGGSGDLSLPVELASFTAENNNNGILLTWTTESEIENLGFILERRHTPPYGHPYQEGNEEWREIASYITHEELRGQGSVTYRTEYSYIDNTVETGQTYDYRLADVSYSGVKEYHSLSVLSITVREVIPEKFALYPAYPNPFNPATTIAFDLPSAQRVVIAIYDLNGREVATLTNREYSAGLHSVKWNASHFGSGVYLYRLNTGTFASTGKLLLVK